MPVHQIIPSLKSRNAQSLPQIESLENRRLLSADLIGSFAGALPATLPPGGANHATVRVTNPSGQIESGKTTVSLYLSDAPMLDGGALILGTATRNVHLGGGQSAAFPFRFASPSALPDESGYLVARIDGPAATDGSVDETTAVAPQTVAVVQPFVDLVGQIAQEPSTVFVSSSCPAGAVAKVRVFNAGNVAARGPLQITMYASTSGTLDSSATVISVATFPDAAIHSGGSRQFAVHLSLPAGTPVGGYTLLASINSSHSIAESNTANNLAVGQHPFAVAAAPTLIDLRDHHHQDDNNNDQSVILIDDGSDNVDLGYVDNSGSDNSAPAPADTGGDTPAPATAPSDPATSPDPGTPSDPASPADSGSSSDGGSDFGAPAPVDPSAGSDF